MRSSGLEVDLAQTGKVRPLPAGVDLAAYRIVQEGLTNVRRHSAAGCAEVVVAFSEELLRVEVHDVGPPVQAPPEPCGHGLVGIRERVALYGVSVTAGPDGQGGFRLQALLEVAT